MHLLENNLLSEALLYNSGSLLAEDFAMVQVVDLVLLDQLEFLLIYCPSLNYFSSP